MPSRTGWRLALAATLAAALTACDDAPSPGPERAAVASIVVSPATLQLNVGQQVTAVAVPRDAAGNSLPGRAISWASSDESVVTVTSAGQVQAHAPGIAYVHAESEGKRGTVAVTVSPVVGDVPLPFDLVFERWDTDAGGIDRPWLHRLDTRTPDAAPVSIFATAGTSDATTSPDGLRIAFTCATGSGTGICVADRDGGNVAMLPGFGQLGGLLGDQPAWSPDGARIAFRGWAQGGPPGIFNPADIWVMDADGSDRVRLTAGVRETDSYESPAWSPLLADGSLRIAYARESRGADGSMRGSIESIRADGQDRRAITAPGGYVDAQPSWSPDGGAIAFVRTGGTAAGDVWLVSVASGAERQLMRADPSGAQRSPAWSPDGGRIAFVSSHEIIGTYFAWQVYSVRADGTQRVRHTDDRRDKGNPVWLRRLP